MKTLNDQNEGAVRRPVQGPLNQQFTMTEDRPLALDSGRTLAPVTSDLPVPWYDTANIHLCTILDFLALCDEMNLHIDQALILSRRGAAKPIGKAPGWANLVGEQGVFLLRRG